MCPRLSSGGRSPKRLVRFWICCFPDPSRPAQQSTTAAKAARVEWRAAPLDVSEATSVLQGCVAVWSWRHNFARRRHVRRLQRQRIRRAPPRCIVTNSRARRRTVHRSHTCPLTHTQAALSDAATASLAHSHHGLPELASLGDKCAPRRLSLLPSGASRVWPLRRESTLSALAWCCQWPLPWSKPILPACQLRPARTLRRGDELSAVEAARRGGDGPARAPPPRRRRLGLSLRIGKPYALKRTWSICRKRLRRCNGGMERLCGGSCCTHACCWPHESAGLNFAPTTPRSSATSRGPAAGGAAPTNNVHRAAACSLAAEAAGAC